MSENILQILVTIVIIISLWKIFQKAGEKGWYAIVPIYNLYILTKIIGKKWWWVILYIIPYFGIIWIIWTTNRLRKSFEKNWIFLVGMTFLPFIFFPIIAFDTSLYTNLKKAEQEKEPTQAK